MFVSIHIPKTAGTALGRIFDEASLRRVMYDYGTERDLAAARHCPAEIREHRDFIQNHFKYLHGHFHFLKYDRVFEDAPTIATVRNPVDRVISQYRHIVRGGDRNVERHRLIMDGDMDIVQFASFPFIGNAQWYYLEGREVEDYDFIFVQERLELSLWEFTQRCDAPEITRYLSAGGGIPVVNEKPAFRFRRGKDSRIAPDVQAQIALRCDRDIEVYERAKQAF